MGKSKSKSKIKKEILVDGGAVDSAKLIAESECPSCFIRSNYQPKTSSETKFNAIKDEYLTYTCQECGTKWRVKTDSKVYLGNILLYLTIIVGAIGLFIFFLSFIPMFILIKEAFFNIGLIIMGGSFLFLILMIILAILME